MSTRHRHQQRRPAPPYPTSHIQHHPAPPPPRPAPPARLPMPHVTHSTAPPPSSSPPAPPRRSCSHFLWSPESPERRSPQLPVRTSTGHSHIPSLRRVHVPDVCPHRSGPSQIRAAAPPANPLFPPVPQYKPSYRGAPCSPPASLAGPARHPA